MELMLPATERVPGRFRPNDCQVRRGRHPRSFFE